jgi:hypothetical protein
MNLVLYVLQQVEHLLEKDKPFSFCFVIESPPVEGHDARKCHFFLFGLRYSLRSVPRLNKKVMGELVR